MRKWIFTIILLSQFAVATPAHARLSHVGAGLAYGAAGAAAILAGIFVVGALLEAGQSSRSQTYGLPVYDYPNYGYPKPYSVEVNYVPNYVAPPAPRPESLAYYAAAAQTPCRTVSQLINVNGITQERMGTICLQPDGAWRIVQ